MSSHFSTLNYWYLYWPQKLGHTKEDTESVLKHVFAHLVLYFMVDSHYLLLVVKIAVFVYFKKGCSINSVFHFTVKFGDSQQTH